LLAINANARTQEVAINRRFREALGPPEPLLSICAEIGPDKFPLE